MNIDEKVKKRIKEIEEDARYQSGLKKPAEIEINAPLALIQLSFEVEIKVLREILKDLPKTSKQVISGYHRPVCGKCHCELRPETNGIGLLDMASFGPYEIFDADLWKCPKCGMTVIGGFGFGPLSAYYEGESFKRIIAGYETRGLLIENSG